MYNSSSLISCWFFGSIYVIWASRWVSLDVCTRMSGVYFTLRLPRGNAREKNEEKKIHWILSFAPNVWPCLYTLRNFIIFHKDSKQPLVNPFFDLRWPLTLSDQNLNQWRFSTSNTSNNCNEFIWLNFQINIFQSCIFITPIEITILNLNPRFRFIFEVIFF